MLIHDTATAAARAVTPEGFLRVRARIGRSGIHLYRAAELGAPAGFAPVDTVRVYRGPDEVFGSESMASFAAKPVTDGHPPAMVDASNWKRYAVGQSGPEVTRDGDHLATDLLITDGEAVKRVEVGAQLSNGYLADFDFTPGTTPDGEPYDATQSNIRGNHIALVDAGRCGDSCRIGDADGTVCGCGSALTSVTVDGVTIEVTTGSVEAIERLRRKVEAQEGTIAALTTKVPDSLALDALVADRAQVIERARAALGAGFEPRGLTTDGIRRAVVSRVLGADLGARGEVYVSAAFDALCATDAARNPLAAHLAGADPRQAGDARRARDRFLTQAWKGETPGVS